MLDKKIVISRHAFKRFQERGIRFYKDNASIIKQIKFDLNPLNIRVIKKLNEVEYMAITKQGKCYITVNLNEEQTLIKTVYQLDKKGKGKYCNAN